MTAISPVPILLVDDNPAKLLALESLLAPLGLRLLTARSGNEALNVLLHHEVAVILSDVNMPDMDGFALAETIRRHPRFAHTPIIFLSSVKTTDVYAFQGYALGAVDYLSELIPEVVRAKVKVFVELFEKTQALHTLNAELEQRVRDRTAALTAANQELQQSLAEQQRITTALQESEARFAAAFDHCPLALTVTAVRDGRLLAVNEGFLHLSGYTRDEAIGRTIDELGLWIDPEQRRQRFVQLLAGQIVPDIEARFRIKNGEERLGVIGSALIQLESQPCVLSSVVDITERKRALDALRAADLRLRSHIEHSPLAVIEWDQELRVSQWSPRAEQLFGWSAAEILGKRRTDFRFVVEEDELQVQNAIAPFLLTAPTQSQVPWEVHENRNYAKDGRILHCEWYNSFLYDETGQLTSILSLVNDVTLRKQDEEARLRLAAIVESSDDAIVSKSLHGIVTSWNAGAERIFGYRAEEMIGQPILRIIPEERYAEEDMILARVRRGERIDHFETVRRTKDGQLINVSVTISPIRNERGVIIGASKIARDISERKRTEEVLASAHADLRQIAYIAAHDLQEPARQVGIYTQMISKGHCDALDDNAKAALSFIKEGAQRMIAQLNDLLQYLEIDVSRLARVSTDCEVVLQRVLEQIRPAITENQAVITYDPLPTIKMHPTHLQLVFHELIDNAMKFRDTAPPRVHIWAGREARGWRFAVRDHGIGIDPQYYGQLFGLFKRLSRKRHPGTGMGLALCKKIVERYGGSIWLEPTPGGGVTAVFTISDEEMRMKGQTGENGLASTT